MPALLTVATAGVPDVHGLLEAGVPEPISEVVELTQTFKVPVIVGVGLTVTVTVKVFPLQVPDVGVTV